MRKVSELLISVAFAACGHTLAHIPEPDRRTLIRAEGHHESRKKTVKLHVDATGSIETDDSAGKFEVGIPGDNNTGGESATDCRDIILSCDAHKDDCSDAGSDGDFAKKKCKQTCGLCDADLNRVVSCMDTADNCAVWVGQCQEAGENGDYARENCKAACGLCGGTFPGGGTVSDCQDLAEDCDAVACNTKHGKENCSSTCNMCSSDPDAGCADNGNCDAWKSDCDSEYARLNCRQTCARCPANVTACKDTATDCNVWSDRCDEDYAKENCQETCYVCAGGGPTQTEVEDADIGGEEGGEGDILGGEICQDTATDCEVYVEAQGCDQNYTKDKCKLSCNLCVAEGDMVLHNGHATAGDGPGCHDSATNCADWQPYCTDVDDSGAYAKEKCKVTCGLCGTGDIFESDVGKGPPEECTDIAENCETDWQPYCGDDNDNGRYAKEKCMKTCNQCPTGLTYVQR